MSLMSVSLMIRMLFIVSPNSNRPVSGKNMQMDAKKTSFQRVEKRFLQFQKSAPQAYSAC